MTRFIGLLFLKGTLITIFLLAASDKPVAQSPDFSFINDQFESYRQQALQEKIYVHTDKNFYLAGEILWFRLYNVDASFHKPLDISKVAYVEILDRNTNPLLQTKVALNKGGGNGSLQLPQDLGSGNYIFRAYTNWMKNFDPDFYFEKEITIVNTIKADLVSTQKAAPINYDVQFFPEGGNLVNGIESMVGFRVADQYGKGADGNGIIINQDNDTVLRFQTLRFGIGSFQFLPQGGKTYKALIDLPDGNRVAKELPKSYEQGYVFHIEKTENGSIRAIVQTHAGVDGQNVYLFVHAKQQIAAALSATINSSKAEFLIDETKLGEGIAHFTLFNNMRQPVCERLFFKRPANRLMIAAKANEQQYESRKKSIIDINTSDEKGTMQPADLSVSVYRLDSSDANRENIFSYLWLSSDLKGRVESAGYYFTETGPVVDKAMDNLMLTHGWRRFKWEDVLQTKTPSFRFLPEYEGHIVTGTVHNRENSKLASGVLSYLALPGSHFKFYAGKSNDSGQVHFFTKDFYGPQEIFAQAGGRERNFAIDIKTPFSERYSSARTSPFSLAEVSGHMLQSNSVSMQVGNTYAGDRLNKMLYPVHLDTSLFFATPTRTYVLDNYVRFPTMEEVLREYVQEIAVNKINNNLFLAGGRRDAAGIVYRYEPLVMIDGVPLFDDPNKVFGYDPLKVQELQIVNRKYFLGPASFEGIINFKTYTGRPEGLIIDPNATVLDYEGLQLHREFYAPVYETQEQRNNRLPDFRNLLFWAPDFKTNTLGKGQLSFYTSDQSGKYVVLIQGITPDGRAGSKTFTIDVINPLFVQH